MADYDPSCPCSRCSAIRRTMSEPPSNSVTGGQDFMGVDFGVGPDAALFVMFGRADADIAPTPAYVIPEAKPVRRKSDFFDRFEAGATPAAGDILRDAWAKVAELDAEDLANAERYRKATPVATGFMGYFPKAIREVARVSKIANDKHNPGEPLHWARAKSTAEADSLARHLLDYLEGKDFEPIYNAAGEKIAEVPVLAELAWRAMALLERWCEGENPGR